MLILVESLRCRSVGFHLFSHRNGVYKETEREKGS
jgi:hypothetical protein